MELRIKSVQLHFVSKYFYKMKHLIFKFPAYHYVLKAWFQ